MPAILNLASLQKGIPALTPSLGGTLAESASVCLEHNDHPTSVALKVVGDFNHEFDVRRLRVSRKMKRAYRDMQVTTEHGAYGLAILLVRELTGWTAVERSVKGTGFDYWLGDSDDRLFDGKARLEVSGILTGDDGQVSHRMKEKKEQTKRSRDSGLPACAVVVEFGAPLSSMCTV